MKNWIWIVSALASLSPLAAHAASLDCTGQDGASLSLSQGEAGSATAVVETAHGKSSLHGSFHVVPHSLFFTVEEYDLVDAAGEASKVLVSTHTPVGRGGCGRAGCPPVGSPGSASEIQASWEIGGQELSLDCESGS